MYVGMCVSGIHSSSKPQKAFRIASACKIKIRKTMIKTNKNKTKKNIKKKRCINDTL